jgi:hypothetical protein
MRLWIYLSLISFGVLTVIAHLAVDMGENSKTDGRKVCELDAVSKKVRELDDSKGDLHVVTTTFNEPLVWISHLCDLLPGVRVRWFVYDKSPTPIALPNVVGSCHSLGFKHVHLPANVGREGHSWLLYMLEPENLGPINVFLQGKPQANLQTVASIAIEAKPFNAICPVTCGSDGEEWFIMPKFESEMKVVANAMGVDYRKLCHHYYGEFVADRATLQYAVGKWGGVMRDILIPALEVGNDPMMGHALERMWYTILTHH